MDDQSNKPLSAFWSLSTEQAQAFKRQYEMQEKLLPQDTDQEPDLGANQQTERCGNMDEAANVKCFRNTNVLKKKMQAYAKLATEAMNTSRVDKPGSQNIDKIKEWSEYYELKRLQALATRVEEDMDMSHDPAARQLDTINQGVKHSYDLSKVDRRLEKDTDSQTPANKVIYDSANILDRVVRHISSSERSPARINESFLMASQRHNSSQLKHLHRPLPSPQQDIAIGSDNSDSYNSDQDDTDRDARHRLINSESDSRDKTDHDTDVRLRGKDYDEIERGSRDGYDLGRREHDIDLRSRSRDRVIVRRRSRDRVIARRSRDRVIARSRSRDRVIARSRRDRVIARSRSRDRVIVRSRSRDQVIARSRSRDRFIARSRSRDRVIARRSRDRVIVRSRSRDRVIARSRSRDRFIARSRSRDRFIARSRSRDRDIRQRAQDFVKKNSRDQDIVRINGRDIDSRSRSRDQDIVVGRRGQDQDLVKNKIQKLEIESRRSTDHDIVLRRSREEHVIREHISPVGHQLVQSPHFSSQNIINQWSIGLEKGSAQSSRISSIPSHDVLGKHTKSQIQKPHQGETRIINIKTSSKTEDIGFQIEQGSQGQIFVSDVVDNSLSANNGIVVGDQILNVSGISFQNTSKDSANRLMQSCRYTFDTLEMVVQFNPDVSQQSSSVLQDIPGRSSTNSPHLVSPILTTAKPRKQHLAPSRKINIRKSFETESIGIKIDRGFEGGIFVSAVNDNSLAASNGIVVGDQILQFSGINFQNVTKELATALMLSCRDTFKIVVQFNPDGLPVPSNAFRLPPQEALPQANSITLIGKPDLAKPVRFRAVLDKPVEAKPVRVRAVQDKPVEAKPVHGGEGTDSGPWECVCGNVNEYRSLVCINCAKLKKQEWVEPAEEDMNMSYDDQMNRPLDMFNQDLARGHSIIGRTLTQPGSLRPPIVEAFQPPQTEAGKPQQPGTCQPLPDSISSPQPEAVSPTRQDTSHAPPAAVWPPQPEVSWQQQPESFQPQSPPVRPPQPESFQPSPSPGWPPQSKALKPPKPNTSRPLPATVITPVLETIRPQRPNTSQPLLAPLWNPLLEANWQPKPNTFRASPAPKPESFYVPQPNTFQSPPAPVWHPRHEVLQPPPKPSWPPQPEVVQSPRAERSRSLQAEASQPLPAKTCWSPQPKASQLPVKTSWSLQPGASQVSAKTSCSQQHEVVQSPRMKTSWSPQCEAVQPLPLREFKTPASEAFIPPSSESLKLPPPRGLSRQQQAILMAGTEDLMVLMRKCGNCGAVNDSAQRVCKMCANPMDFNSKPVQCKPVQGKPAQAKPVHAKPAQAKPAQAKPAQAKLVTEIERRACVLSGALLLTAMTTEERPMYEIHRKTVSEQLHHDKALGQKHSSDLQEGDQSLQEDDQSLQEGDQSLQDAKSLQEDDQRLQGDQSFQEGYQSLQENDQSSRRGTSSQMDTLKNTIDPITGNIIERLRGIVPSWDTAKPEIDDSFKTASQKHRSRWRHCRLLAQRSQNKNGRINIRDSDVKSREDNIDLTDILNDRDVYSMGGREWDAGDRHRREWNAGRGDRREWDAGGRDRREWDAGGRDRREWDASGGDRREWDAGGGDRREWDAGGRDRREWDAGGRDRREWDAGGRDRREWDAGGGDRREWDAESQPGVLGHFSSSLAKDMAMVEPRNPPPGETRTINIRKTSKTDVVGFRIAQGSDGGIMVSFVADNSLAENNGIFVGDEILEFCGNDFRNKTKASASIVILTCHNEYKMIVRFNPNNLLPERFPGSLTEKMAMVKPRKPHPGETRTINIMKKSETDVVGFRITQGSDGGIMVSFVGDNSLAENNGIVVGDEILEFCGNDFRNKTKASASIVILSCHNEYEMVVQFNPDNLPENFSSSLAEEMAMLKPRKPRLCEIRTINIRKRSETDVVGFSIAQGFDGGIMVSFVGDNSLAENNGIVVGDEILEFCGNDFRNETKESASIVILSCNNEYEMIVQFNPDNLPGGPHNNG